MISIRTFDEFFAPCHRQVIPWLLERNICPVIDGDGEVATLGSWFEHFMSGFLPLERQAGVDWMRIA